jgi:hypothetical protein
VKSYFSKFILFSFMLTAAMGFVKGDTSVSNGVDPISVSISVDAQGIMERGVPSSQADKSEKNREDQNFTFKFPNIFDVFRSLF